MKFPPLQNFSIDIIIIAHSAKSTSFRQEILFLCHFLPVLAYTTITLYEESPYVKTNISIFKQATDIHTEMSPKYKKTVSYKKTPPGFPPSPQGIIYHSIPKNVVYLFVMFSLCAHSVNSS